LSVRALALAAAVVLAGCCTTKTNGTPGLAPQLDGTHWTRTDDSDAAPHFPTLEFANGRASGFDGCNRWSANYSQSGDDLRFGAIASTRMACGAESAAATARSFHNAIDETRHVAMGAAQLTLLNLKRHEIAQFSAGD
jgi:heat shock protein HslJ